MNDFVSHKASSQWISYCRSYLKNFLLHNDLQSLVTFTPQLFILCNKLHMILHHTMYFALLPHKLKPCTSNLRIKELSAFNQGHNQFYAMSQIAESRSSYRTQNCNSQQSACLKYHCSQIMILYFIILCNSVVFLISVKHCFYQLSTPSQIVKTNKNKFTTSHSTSTY